MIFFLFVLVNMSSPKLIISNKDVPYKSILTGIQEFSDFSRLFFSRQNIDWLQIHLRYYVHKETGEDIGFQDENALLIIMRSMFLELSRNPMHVKDYTENIMLINTAILNRYIPKLVTAVYVDIKYQAEKLQNKRPIDRPISTNIKGTKTLKSPSSVMNINTLN